MKILMPNNKYEVWEIVVFICFCLFSMSLFLQVNNENLFSFIILEAFAGGVVLGLFALLNEKSKKISLQKKEAMK